MAKKKSHEQGDINSHNSNLVAGEKTVDPALASLFALSSGPVVFSKQAPAQSQESASNPTVPSLLLDNDSRIEESDITSRDGESLLIGSGEASIVPALGVGEIDPRPRKKRRVAQSDDLEARYLNRLVREEAQDAHKSKTSDAMKASVQSRGGAPEQGEPEDNAESESTSEFKTEIVPMHETLAVDDADSTARTVFLGNVSTDAIKSKTARKALEKHLTSVIATLPTHQPPYKLESLRFRSTAFVSGAGPKKAAFAKKELMDKTTKSTNAYVVYSDATCAKRCAEKLNGTVVLDRHLRADYLAQPARTDHRRCIFVGNLSFVDEETPGDATADDSTAPRRAKGKMPADAEEGLWRTFSKVGKVESVRVVRDKETRVGKGFAYVQFVDENGVEAALLMNEKKFPPMLPRKLRVVRAKKTRQKQPERLGVGRPDGKPRSVRIPLSQRKEDARNGLLGPNRGDGSRFRKPESFVFEGSRARISSKGSNGVLKRKKRPAVKPNNRSSRRAEAFKAAGGKRALDPK